MCHATHQLKTIIIQVKIGKEREMSLRPKGVTKRKGLNPSKCLMTNRNRLKVEKLRESFNDLYFEKSHNSKSSVTLRVRLHNLQGIGASHGTIADLSCGCAENHASGDGSTLQIYDCGIHTKVRSHPGKVSFDNLRGNEVDEHQCESASKLLGSQLRDINDSVSSFESQSVSLWDSGSEDTRVSSLSTDTVYNPEAKQDNPLFRDLRVLKIKTDKNPLNALSVSMAEPSNDNNQDEAESSTSPPHSPLLYDIPPPSTPAQKKERRAKRKLQLERWRKYEMSKCRQERYEKREKRDRNSMGPVLESRHIQWSSNLVQTMYINDLLD